MASTDDPNDGPLFCGQNSCHYLNVFGDAGWDNSDETYAETWLQQ